MHMEMQEAVCMIKTADPANASGYQNSIGFAAAVVKLVQDALKP
jgi:hypothetical protein